MASKFEDSLEHFHDNNYFVPTRTILLMGDIDEVNSEKFLKNIEALDSTSGTITVELISGGGDLDLCYALYDTVRGCRNTVNCVVKGLACSSASILLQAFDHRSMTENSYLMLHKASLEIPEQGVDNAEIWLKKTKEDNNKFIHIYLEKMKEVKNLTYRKLHNKLVNDWILSPQEALDWNLIDEIIKKT